MADDEEDLFGAFGSDDEGDDDADENNGSADASPSEDAIAQYLQQTFLKQNSQVKLGDRVIRILCSDQKVEEEGSSSSTLSINTDALAASLRQRGLVISSSTISPARSDANDDDASSQARPCYTDALICTEASTNMSTTAVLNILNHDLVPGGVFIASEAILSEHLLQGGLPDWGQWISTKATITSRPNNPNSRVMALLKPVGRVHASICPWLSASHSIDAEQERLEAVTVALSASEANSSKMTESSLQKAFQRLADHGFVVIRNLLDPLESAKFGQAVLDSVHSAAQRLLERDEVDIYHPHTSSNEPQSYQEMSMREDLRLDLRHGPQLNALRSKSSHSNGNESRVIKASDDDVTNNDGGFLRSHTSLLEIVRRTMNPKVNHLYKGNMGRYNFEGSGPDGSYQDLRVSIVGGIVSFPGAADQALHADTPHLFEHIPNLPAHYINIFTPGAPFHEKVGGTAFIKGSHNLEFTAKYCGEETDDNARVYPFMVRPSLSLGDVVLFDCRVLHFGLANMSDTIERPILYSNTTHAWFHDPKNWDNHQRIFSDEELELGRK